MNSQYSFLKKQEYEMSTKIDIGINEKDRKAIAKGLSELGDSSARPSNSV
jgi:hypothetical protein